MRKKIFQFVILFLLFSTFTATAKSKNEFDIKRFRKEGKNNELIYTASNGNRVRETEMSSVFTQREYSDDYVYYKEFTKEGILQREGQYAKVAKQEIPVGEWKTYDSKGQVTETKNQQEGYEVTFDRVLEICKSRNIDLTDRLSSLSFTKTGERPMWVIGWNSLPPRSEKTSVNDRSSTTKMEVIVVDGVTGHIKESTPYVPFKADH